MGAMGSGRVAFLSLLVLVAVGCVRQGLVADTRPRRGPLADTHSILFYKGLGGYYIHRMNADGSGQAPLNGVWSYTRRLALSPDGRTIAMTGFGGAFQIYTCIIGDERGDQTWLAPGASPAWSPTDGRLAFYYGGLCVLDIGSGVYRRLVASTVAGPYIIDRPAWSPDGTTIAFAVLVGIEQGRIIGKTYLINPDGSGRRELCHLQSSYGPAWSPDGRKIAFVGGENEQLGLYVINPDGSGLKRLTLRRPTHGDFAWSPDSSKIALAGLDKEWTSAFGGHRAGEPKPASRGLHVINADGSGLQPLTSSEKLLASDVAWSPDGGRIAFSGHLWSAVDIYVINADGTGLTRLTDDGKSHAPVWVPRIGDGSADHYQPHAGATSQASPILKG